MLYYTVYHLSYIVCYIIFPTSDVILYVKYGNAMPAM